MSSLIIKGYKSAGKYIIELDIDLSVGHNNLARKVMDKNYAKYRCSSASVVKIYNKFTKENINSIQSDYNNTFVYRKNETVEVIDYDLNDDNICTKGIHFYICYEVAYFHNFSKEDYYFETSKRYTGEYKEWSDDGLLSTIYNFDNGKIHGLYTLWYDNGQLSEKLNYMNGLREGSAERWYTNGQLLMKCNYVDDKREGLFEKWFDNGQLHIKRNYINGLIEGSHENYYEGQFIS